ncbi:hypothetical protein FAF44_12810 [Nonomuraea sp. MG754425]|uniref:hypothetical protein n=1 Tax=Nonomuraea sp. MG754425 TaxID=2570319 RepID=UPI001F28A6B0|nr:hypothetical protein [Nonomuraea sp. MG754425]MCF6469267.1 hypothetical protein [Nonomuraea sp. MG754425]
MTYGVHALFAALQSSGVEHELRLGTTPEETAGHIQGSDADRVLVLWSFYSPDAEAMAAELAEVRSRTVRPGPPARGPGRTARTRGCDRRR